MIKTNVFLFLTIILSYNFLFAGTRKSAYANVNACNKFLNSGWIKTYKYKGVGDPKVDDTMSSIQQTFDGTTEGAVNMPSSEATRKEGSTEASSLTTVEESTTSVDPKQWFNQSTFVLASGISGPCMGYKSPFAKIQIKEQRDLYFEANNEEILKEIAKGEGEHLSALASLSLCDKKIYPVFAKTLQQNMEGFLSSKNSQFQGDLLDKIIQKQEILHSKCEISDI